MLTPSKIKNHHFEASGKNAYRAQSVDDFFEIVADSYEQMFKENGELVKKISLLAERLEEYRNDEDNIRAALLTAQRMADQIMRETNEKSEKQIADATANAKKIEAEATAKADDVVAQAQAQADSILSQTALTSKRLIEEATQEAKEQAVIARDRMIKTQAALGLIEQEADKFKSELLGLYKEHIELISKIPEIQEEPVEEPVEQALPIEEFIAEDDTQAEVTEAIEEIEEIKEAVEDAAPVEDTLQQAEPEEEEIIEAVPFEEVADEVVEAPENQDEISDDKLRDLGFDIPEKEEATQTDFFSFIDEEADDSDDESVSDEPEIDDGYGENDGIKFDLSSLKFGAAEEDDEEYYDEDDDDDEYYDDDEDDDDDEGGFGSKLKGFFKR